MIAQVKRRACAGVLKLSFGVRRLPTLGESLT